MGVPGKKASGRKKPNRPRPQLTAEEHYENAQMAFAMDNLPQARSSFKRALDMEPENLEYLDGYGSFLAECGPPEEAVAVLRRAVQLQPEEGFEKFMYLGQLEEGPEAEQHVRKGISILRAYMQEQAEAAAAEEAAGGGAAAAGAAAAEAISDDDEEEDSDDEEYDKEHLDATLCSCLCALAEQLLNKAQDEAEGGPGVAGVEAEVEALLGEARTLAPTSPEPLQDLASLRQQQGKDEEALALLRQSLALWFKPAEDSEEEEEGAAAGGDKAAAAAAEQQAAADKAAAKAELGAAAEASDDDSEEGSEGGEEMDEDYIEDELPSYEFRFETAKLLLELDDSVDTATQVLEGLLDENDQDPNVWLLLSMCCQGGGDLEGALAAVEEGQSLCKKLRLPKGHAMTESFNLMQAELQKPAAEAGQAEEKEGA